MMSVSLTWYIFIPWKKPNPFITQGWEPPLSLVWYVSLFLFMVFLVSCQSLFKGCMWILIFPQNAEVMMIYASLTCDVLAIRLLSVLEVFNDVFLVNLRRSFHERRLNPFISQRLRNLHFHLALMFCFSFYFHVFFVGWGSGLLGSKFDRIVLPSCLICCHGDLFTMCAWKVTPFHSKVNN
jgi:hypothetical protein